jgi:hypothetical protein
MKERKKDNLFSQQQHNTEHKKLYINNQNHLTYIKQKMGYMGGGGFKERLC